MHTRFKKILTRFNSSKVYIIGDLILDVFIWGKVRRVSPEAPVPVVEVEKDSYLPGGAANVANNMRTLGAKVWLAGVVGEDWEGKELISLIKKKGINTSAIRVDTDRPTTLKTRVVAHHQQVVRIDREVGFGVNGLHEKKFMDTLSQNRRSIGAIVIEDYGKGVISQELISRVMLFAKRESIPVAVDPKKGHFINYRGISFATPNFEEAAYFAGVQVHADDHSKLHEIGKILLEKWDCQGILITLGDQGMCLFEKGEKPYHIPTVAREVYDVSGAGDTVIGTFVVSVLSGATLKEAAHLANLSAGIVVGKLGTAVVSKDEIEKELENVGQV
jgi:D-beta-D-heptose 7-phosphate kinase/D-beta-D-heptose 1-phosphate adenosyltransferase